MFLRQIEQKNYEAQFPQPNFLLTHKQKHPDSFYIQLIGARGVGKSSFANWVIIRSDTMEK